MQTAFVAAHEFDHRKKVMSECDRLGWLRMGVRRHQRCGVLAREGEEHLAGRIQVAHDFENVRPQAHSVLRDRDIVPASRGMHCARDGFESGFSRAFFYEEEEIFVLAVVSGG